MTEVAKVYGGSLYDLAVEENKQQVLLEQLDQVCGVFADQPEYLRLLSTPSIPKSERCGLLDEAFKGSIDQYLLNFLKILCENGTLSELRGCAEEFHDRYDADNGVLRATVTSAVPLTHEQAKALGEKLSKSTGKQVHLLFREDPAVVGGIRLEMDGVQMDGTVESRLNAIKEVLAKTTL